MAFTAKISGMAEQRNTLPVRTAEAALVVDVDGTLIKTDILHEKVMQFIARNPWETWRLPFWLVGGRSRLKVELSERVPLDVALLPLRDETIAHIRTAQAEGRPVYLASASEQQLVRRLADEIGGIDGVFGTDASINAAGRRKAEKLNAALGEHGYDYIGDRAIDFAVWRSARRVLAISHYSGFSRRLRGRFPDAEIIAEPRVSPRNYLRAMRPHQWAKNILVFLPLIAGHHFDPATIGATVLAFVCFCLAASSAYVINDLLDLPGDRAHPRKRLRPFAAGEVPIAHGVAMGLVLMMIAFALSLFLPWHFVLILGGYVALTLGYSFVLKRKVLIDVIALGGLYTIRVFGGVEAAAQQQSQWLLMFSLFLFMCLATVKRCSELIARREAKQPLVGRGYRSCDLNVLFPLGAASAFSAVLVVTLYLSSPEVRALYSHPMRMWLVCPPLLYWISRVLVLANRNEMHDDPVIFALTDRVSWLTAALVAAIVAFSI
jgi:4-hydroxybenzoate polyprenyltransferase/phosphoserine phosphatase